MFSFVVNVWFQEVSAMAEYNKCVAFYNMWASCYQTCVEIYSQLSLLETTVGYIDLKFIKWKFL